MQKHRREKSRSLSASCRRRALSSARPSFQVVMTTYSAAAMVSGNQPPCTILSAFEAKNNKSMARKKPVAAMHSKSG